MKTIFISQIRNSGPAWVAPTLALVGLISTGALAADQDAFLVVSRGAAVGYGTVGGGEKSNFGSDCIRARISGTEYVIQDAKTVREAWELLEPQRQIAAQQAELGARQAQLGHQQAQLGQEQAAIGVEQAQRALRGEEEPGLEQRQRDLEKQQHELEKQQHEFEKQQEALENQHDPMEANMRSRLRGLVERAIASGLAQKVGATKR